MARSTMATLISAVRDLVNDPSPGTFFTDDQIQRYLDLTRYDVFRDDPGGRLQERRTYDSGGVVAWHDYFAADANWEDDIVLQDASFNTLTPDVPDLITGHWQFTVSQTPPVYVKYGKTYDPYGAAADLLIMLKGQMQLESVDIGHIGRQAMFSQVMTNIDSVIADLRAKRRMRQLSWVRQDEITVDQGEWPHSPALNKDEWGGQW